MRHVTLAKIETDSGLVGWGECISQWPEAALAVKPIIERGIGPVLIGRDPLENHALYLALKEHVLVVRRHRRGREFCYQRARYCAVGLEGQRRSACRYILCSAASSTTNSRACASTHPSKAKISDLAQRNWQTTRGTDTRRSKWVSARRAKQISAQTPNAISSTCARCGKPSATTWISWWTWGKRRNGILRRASKMAREFEKYNLRWIEDPFPPTNIKAYKRLRQSIQTQIGFGEREWTPAGYKRLIDEGCADVYLARSRAGRAESQVIRR